MNNRAHIILIHFFLLFLLLPEGADASKDWSIPKVEIDAGIRPDGSILYTEKRTYRFQGSFSEVDYNLPKTGFTEITDLRVFEGDTPYLNLDTGEPGTFRVKDKRRSIDITIYYRATDEERTFTIQYVLHGAIVTGPDHAEFNWIYLSDRWERGTDDLVVMLGLPGDVPAGEIHTWIRGASYKTTIRKDAAQMRASASNIGRNERVQIRTLFPSAVLVTPVNDPDLTLAFAEEQERLWNEERIRNIEIAARNRVIAKWASLALIMAGLTVLIGYYRKYGKLHRLPQRIPPELYELPVNEPPAITGWLYYQTYIGGTQLMATMLDLARRGYFKMEEFKTTSTFLKPGSSDFYLIPNENIPDETLSEWEEYLLGFLMSSVREGKKPLKEIFKQGSGSVQKAVEKWVKMVSKDAKTRNWYDEESKTGMKKNLLFQVVLVLVSIPAMIFISELFAILFIAATLLAVLSLIIQRRSVAGELAYQRITAYRNALTRGKPSEFITPKDKTIHLLYAIALGVTGKRFENLTNNLNIQDVSWLYFHGGVFNPAQLAATMNNLAATGTSTVGSVAGGSGAVAGSGGGGAGGGAR
ncbi:MAG: DUF2207 domain-containing protein [Balneolaceae bacterium]|nr:MAG: DUF2207 domain-containing protein [Balneolaceae bacterium]